MENPLNTVTEFLTQEWSKTVEYQTQSWADAKLQLATNQEQIVVCPTRLSHSRG